MRLGLQLGYDDPGFWVGLAEEAERCGFHSVWTSEAYGSDALTPAGRTVAEGMVTAYTRLTHAEVPADHLARAVAYVATTRALWLQRQGGTHPS